jgi:hypothetical protein
MEAQEFFQLEFVDNPTVCRKPGRYPSFVQPSLDDSLRLLRAFARIRQPALREAVIKLAAKYAVIDD